MPKTETECRRCAYNKEHGWCGPEFANLAHCRDCHRDWGLQAHSQCHCAGCHEHFGGESPFKMHQASGECRDPATLFRESTGNPMLMVKQTVHGPMWITWHHPDAVEKLLQETWKGEH